MMIKPLCSILILCAFLPPFSLHAQDFYSIDRVQEIKIYFNQPNWRQLLNTAATSSSEPFTLAKKISINGIVFDSIGAKFKGNSTFKMTNKKNPWHIELDHFKDQNYQGYKDIKLANVFSDPSFVREALSYELMSDYTDLPRANFAKVWVNDTLVGLYTNTEAITKSFCKRHFYSSDNNVFVKCTPPSLMGGGGGSSLIYLGADSSKYFSSYEMKSDAGWQQLIHLCDTLNNSPGQIEKILDVDHTLWMLAFNILFVNLDSYTGGFTQNYYLWRDDNRQFIPVIWDLNQSFGSFTNVNSIGGGGGPGLPGAGTDSLSLAKLFPYTHEMNTAKPLISKLLTNPRYRKMFRAHLITMTQELFRPGKYLIRALEMQKTIDPYVKEDVNKFFTYDQFKSNLYYGIASSGVPGSGGPGGFVGIVSLMKNRVNYLDTLADMKLAAPVISNVNSIRAKVNDTAWIKTTVNGYSGNGVLLGYRVKNTDFFTRVAMYDDGLHHDGAAQDGLFSYGLKMINPTIQYYIWAENNNAGVFSPVNAEHNYYEIAAQAIASDIVVNEFMASNSTTAKDPGGQYDDWIELFNKSNSTVDLTGWHITDNPDNLTKWKIPKGTQIPGQGYLIIWADEDSSQNTATNLHSNFKLSAGGETVILLNNDASIADQVTFGAQKTDLSYARIPNGTGSFIISTPTFNANNTKSTPVFDASSTYKVSIYPNPVINHTVTIKTTSNRKAPVSILNALGQIIYNDSIINEKQINTYNWSKGVYFISLNDHLYKFIIP